MHPNKEKKQLPAAQMYFNIDEFLQKSVYSNSITFVLLILIYFLYSVNLTG